METTGLRRLNKTRRPGLVALKNVAAVTGPIGGYEVGFQLAPRLNAAGRMETAAQALDLLLAGSLAHAEPLARELDARNRERQRIERGIAEEVIGAVRARLNAATDYSESVTWWNGHIYDLSYHGNGIFEGTYDSLRTQITWSRVITNYHRDSDVFLLGAGVAF